MRSWLTVVSPCHRLLALNVFLKPEERIEMAAPVPVPISIPVPVLVPHAAVPLAVPLAPAAAAAPTPLLSSTLHGGGGGAAARADPGLLQEVRDYMKSNRVSQIVAAQEARVSQADISQWLSPHRELICENHNHNDKVRTSDVPMIVRLI